MADVNEKQNEIIDLHGLLEEYKSKWYVFAICIVACLLMAWVYSKIAHQQYEVKANILISQDESRGSAGGGFLAAFGDISNVFGNAGQVEDEVFMVGSHTVLRNAIKELGAHKTHYVKPDKLTKIFHYRDFPIDVFAAPTLADTLMNTVNFKVKVNDEGHIKVTAKVSGNTVANVEADRFPVSVKTEWGDFIVNKTKYFKPGENLDTRINFKGYHVAAEELSEKIEVYLADKRANVISLRYHSTDAEYAKDMLNAVIRNYNQRGIDERTGKSQKTSEFLEGRLALLSGDLLGTEDELESFLKKEGMSDLEADLLYSFTKKGEIEKELITAQTQAEVMKMLRDFVSDPANEHSLMPATAATPEASEAIAAYNSMILQRMELARDSKTGSIPLKTLDEQLSAMRENMISTLERGRQSAMLSIRDIQAQINATDARLGNVPHQRRIYRQISRQQNLKEDLYMFLLQRLEETKLTLANSVPKGVVVDEAFSLTETKGLSRTVILALGLIFGLILAPVILYIRRMTRNKFENREELQKLTKVPILGEICKSRMGQHLVVKPGSHSSVVELVAALRGQLQFMMSEADDKVILMTSTVSGEGKSFVSVNLAASMALQQHRKVLLVGMDIRAPRLAQYLGLHPRFGMTEYLSRPDLTIQDIILKSPVEEVPGLDIVVAGPVPPNPSELLLSKRVDEFFEEARKLYDVIIIDSAPVGMVSDTFALVRVSDATVYVCRANKTTLRDVRFFNELYETNRLRKMSLVINGTNTNKGYGYGYGEQHKSTKKKR